MRYLIIDKKQRVEIKGEYPYATQRIFDELKKKEIPYDFGYTDEIEMFFDNTDPKILVNGKDIRDFSHILFRGHRLDSLIGYETKVVIANYIEQHNVKNKKNVLIQNSKTIKKLPYYDKLYIGLLCAEFGIPYIPSYYRTDGSYPVKPGQFGYPLIIKNYSGANDMRVIDGKEKIKKNVYLVENVDEFKQEHLVEKDLKDYFTQEFIPGGEDIRIFVSKGEPIGAWIRRATEGFMTVSKGEYSIYDLEKDIIAKKFAKNVAQKFEADFMAVDIMYDARSKKPLLQEISLTPGFKAFETKLDNSVLNVAQSIIEAF